MKKLSHLFILLSLTTLSNTAWSEEAVAATVNGQPLPQAIVNAHVRTVGGDDAVKNLQGAQRDALVAELIGRELLVQEAKKAGLDKSPEVQADIADKTAMVLSAAFMRHWLQQHQPSEEVLKQEYDRQAQLPAPKQFKTRHILTATEQEARSVIAALAQANFAELATQRSIDTATKTKGGELDWMLPPQMFPSYFQAVINLQKGSYTQTPVQSPIGWHVIMLEDVQDAPKPTFEKAKPLLIKGLTEQQWQKFVMELRSQAKIETVK